MDRRSNSETFSFNLNALTVMRGLSRKDAAEQITESQMVEIPAKWYRKLCNQGLAQVKGSSAERLHAIAQFFGLPSMNHLWHPDLIIFGLRKDAMLPDEAESMVKLEELLKTGEHDYLRGLIANLYACQFSEKNSSSFGQGQSDLEREAPTEEEIRDENEEDAEPEQDWG